MELKVDLVRCSDCGEIRERFLIGCPKCGSNNKRDVDPDKDFTAFVKVTLESIALGAKFYKDNLYAEQRKFFRERIPRGQDWQFYAGVIVTTRMMLPWLQSKLSFEDYSDPISIINSRCLYVMSFETVGKQTQFCDFLNKLNMELTQEGREEIDQTHIQGEDEKSDS